MMDDFKVKCLVCSHCGIATDGLTGKPDPYCDLKDKPCHFFLDWGKMQAMHPTMSDKEIQHLSKLCEEVED